MKNTSTDKITQLETTIRALERQAHLAATALASIRKELARGTGDVTEQAAAAVTAAKSLGIYDRIEAALRSGPASLKELASVVGAAAGKVNTLLSGMKRSHKVYNLGSEDDPRYVWCIGDDASVDELRKTVEMLIRIRPLTLQELVAATGLTNRNRISGVLVRIQMDMTVLNLGTRARAIYFIPPPGRAKRPTRG